MNTREKDLEIIRTAKQMTDFKVKERETICNNLIYEKKHMLNSAMQLNETIESDYCEKKFDVIMGNLEVSLLTIKRHIAFYRKFKK